MRKSRKKKKKKTRNFVEMNSDEQQGPLAIRVSLYFLLQFYTPADGLVFLREHGHTEIVALDILEKTKKPNRGSKSSIFPSAAEWTWVC